MKRRECLYKEMEEISQISLQSPKSLQIHCMLGKALADF